MEKESRLSQKSFSDVIPLSPLLYRTMLCDQKLLRNVDALFTRKTPKIMQKRNDNALFRKFHLRITPIAEITHPRSSYSIFITDFPK